MSHNSTLHDSVEAWIVSTKEHCSISLIEVSSLPTCDQATDAWRIMHAEVIGASSPSPADVAFLNTASGRHRSLMTRIRSIDGEDNVHP